MIASADRHSTDQEVSLPRCPNAESALLGWILLNGSRVREVLDHIVKVGCCVRILAEEIDRLINENTIPTGGRK